MKKRIISLMTAMIMLFTIGIVLPAQADDESPVEQLVNLITNGDFTDDFEGWTNAADGGVYDGIIISNTDDHPEYIHGDGKAITNKVSANGHAASTLRRYIEVESGKTYKLSFHVYNTETTTKSGMSAFVPVKADSKIFGSFEGVTFKDYTQYGGQNSWSAEKQSEVSQPRADIIYEPGMNQKEYTITVPDDADYIMISMFAWTDPGRLYFSDFELYEIEPTETPTPEPDTTPTKNPVTGSYDTDTTTYTWEFDDEEEYIDTNSPRNYETEDKIVDFRLVLRGGDYVHKDTGIHFNDKSVGDSGSIQNSRYILVKPVYDGILTVDIEFTGAKSNKKCRLYAYDYGTESDFDSIDETKAGKGGTMATSDITDTNTATRTLDLEGGHTYAIYTYQTASNISALSYKVTEEIIPEETETPIPEPDATETPEPSTSPEPDATETPEPSTVPEPDATGTPEPTDAPTTEPTATPDPDIPERRNLITNGDFTNGFEDWPNAANGGVYDGIISDNTDYIHGNGKAVTTKADAGANAASTIRRYIDVEKGKTYKLSFYVYNTGATTKTNECMSAFVPVKADSKIFGTLDGVTFKDYTQYGGQNSWSEEKQSEVKVKRADIIYEPGMNHKEYMITVPEDADYIMISIFAWTKAGRLYFSDFELYEYIEPTTEPTTAPTTEPTEAPTTEPTATPTTKPTDSPTDVPTTKPTEAPTTEPTTKPTTPPTSEPDVKPWVEAAIASVGENGISVSAQSNTNGEYKMITAVYAENGALLSVKIHQVTFEKDIPKNITVDINVSGDTAVFFWKDDMTPVSEKKLYREADL